MGVKQQSPLMSVTSISHATGIHPQKVKQLLEPCKPDGKVQSRWDGYRLESVLPYLKPAIPDAPNAGGDDPDAREVDPENMHPKDRKDWYQGDEIRLKLETAAGLLVISEDVRRDQAMYVQTLLGPFESLPDVLERDCGASPEMIVRAEEIIDRLRQEAYDAVIESLGGSE